MKPELRLLYSSDLPHSGVDLPEDLENFWVVIHAEIGIEGEDGADRFTLYVTTLKFLSDSMSIPIFGRGLLILESFSWEVIRRFIDGLCLKNEGHSAKSVMNKLSRFMIYEYEGYEEFDEYGGNEYSPS